MILMRILQFANTIEQAHFMSKEQNITKHEIKKIVQPKNSS